MKSSNGEIDIQVLWMILKLKYSKNESLVFGKTAGRCFYITHDEHLNQLEYAQYLEHRTIPD